MQNIFDAWHVRLPRLPGPHKVGAANLTDENIICRFQWTDAFFLYTIGLFSSDSALSGCLYLLSFRKE